MRRKYKRALEEFNAKGYGELATYNAERARGIVHTPEHAARMAEIQRRFDVEHGRAHECSKLIGGGWIICGEGGNYCSPECRRLKERGAPRVAHPCYCHRLPECFGRTTCPRDISCID